MNQLIEYVRDENGQPTAVFLADQEGDHVRIGYALCHIGKDTFSKKLGKHIALGRAIKLWGESDGGQVWDKVPIRIVDGFERFVRRCEYRRSYQGKQFPFWTFE